LNYAHWHGIEERKEISLRICFGCSILPCRTFKVSGRELVWEDKIASIAQGASDERLYATAVLDVSCSEFFLYQIGIGH